MVGGLRELEDLAGAAHVGLLGDGAVDAQVGDGRAVVDDVDLRGQLEQLTPAQTEVHRPRIALNQVDPLLVLRREGGEHLPRPFDEFRLYDAAHGSAAVFLHELAQHTTGEERRRKTRQQHDLLAIGHCHPLFVASRSSNARCTSSTCCSV